MNKDIAAIIVFVAVIAYLTNRDKAPKEETLEFINAEDLPSRRGPVGFNSGKLGLST